MIPGKVGVWACKVHLEFLPSCSPELMPAERLWPLSNEAIANRLFEEISEVEEALLERCHQLLDQAKTIRDLTTTPGGPRRHDARGTLHPNSV